MDDQRDPLPCDSNQPRAPHPRQGPCHYETGSQEERPSSAPSEHQPFGIPTLPALSASLLAAALQAEQSR